MSSHVLYLAIYVISSLGQKYPEWSQLRPLARFVPCGSLRPPYTNSSPGDPLQSGHRVRQILSTRGVSLYQVSQRSAELFGRSSPYYIPQRLYQELATGALSANIHQLIAFSRVTNHRLCDWLAVFGFRLGDIPRLQLQIAWRRTVLLDPSIYDEDQWVP